MSGIDLLVIGVVLVSVLVSFVRGFVKEAVSLSIWVAAIVITVLFSSRFATLLPSETIQSPAARAAISALALFFGSMLIGSLINWLVRKIVAGATLGIADRLGGIAFGFARGLLIITLLVLAANLLPTLKEETWWRESVLLPRFQGAARLIHARLPEEMAQYFDFTQASL